MNKDIIDKLETWKFYLNIAKNVPMFVLLEAAQTALTAYKSNTDNKEAEQNFVGTSMAVIMKIAIQKDGFDAVMESIKKGELGKSFLDFKPN